jgi:hypothetical protein
MICTQILATLAVPAAAVSLDSFEQGNAGWTAVTIRDAGRPASSQAGFLADGGNPAGHLSAPLEGEASRLYAVQPPLGESSRYGNLTGKTLAVDYRLDGIVGGQSGDRKVRFFIGYAAPGGEVRYWVSNAANSWSPDTGGAWTTRRVSMEEDSFFLWQGRGTSGMTFEEVLKNYNDIGLVFVGDPGDRREQGLPGQGMVRIDNFGVYTERGAAREKAAAPSQAQGPRQAVEPSPKQPSVPSGPTEPPPELGDFGLSPEALFPMALQLGGYLFVAGMAAALLTYMVFALFLYLIARKLAVPSAWVAWVPIAQVHTMVAAAGKPWWWTALLLVPLLSWVPILGLAAALFTLVDLVLVVLVWMAVCRRLGENKWLGVLFLLPVVQWLLMGYLALKREPKAPSYSPARIMMATGGVFVVMVAGLWGVVTFLVMPQLSTVSPVTASGDGPAPSVSSGLIPAMEEPEILDLSEADYRDLLGQSEVPGPSGRKAAAAGPARIFADRFWANESDPHVWVKVRLPEVPNLHLFDAGRLAVTSVRTAAGEDAYHAESGLEKAFFQKIDFKRQAGPPPFLEALRDVHLLPGTQEEELKALEGKVHLRLPVGVKTHILTEQDEGRTVNLNGTEVTLDKMDGSSARLKIENRPERFLTALAYLDDRPASIAGHSSWSQEDVAGVQYQFGGKANRIKVVVADEIVEMEYPFSVSF